MIKLAHTVYIVREELIRRLEICANVTSPVMNTPIDFDFYVEINTVDGTAGTYLGIIHTTLVYTS